MPDKKRIVLDEPQMFTYKEMAVYFQYGEKGITYLKKADKRLGEVTPTAIDALALEKLQKFGITFKKADDV